MYYTHTDNQTTRARKQNGVRGGKTAGGLCMHVQPRYVVHPLPEISASSLSLAAGRFSLGYSVNWRRANRALQLKKARKTTECPLDST